MVFISVLLFWSLSNICFISCNHQTLVSIISHIPNSMFISHFRLQIQVWEITCRLLSWPTAVERFKIGIVHNLSWYLFCQLLIKGLLKGNVKMFVGGRIHYCLSSVSSSRLNTLIGKLEYRISLHRFVG